MQKRRGKSKRQLGAIEEEILSELSLGDMLYGFFLSARSTSRMFRLARERATFRYRRKRAVARLIERELIRKRGEKLTITSAGTSALGELVDKTRELLGTRKWDRKWRVVAFDIPEHLTSLRDKVRRILKETGFVKLQQSIWVFPHECKELVTLIKEESRLAPHILYGVLESIEGEDRLRKVFKL
jgi:DNA-binding transcriptional regulator PaaX